MRRASPLPQLKAAKVRLCKGSGFSLGSCLPFYSREVTQNPPNTVVPQGSRAVLEEGVERKGQMEGITWGEICKHC